MSWAEVKKINSDMNTPIDILLLSIRKFAPSNDELLSFYSETSKKIYIQKTKKVLGTITPALNGTLSASCYGGAYSGSVPCILEVLGENNQIVAQTNISGTNNNPSESTVNFPVIRGKRYYVCVEAPTAADTSANQGSLTNVSIKGKVEDIGVMSYTTYQQENENA